MKIINLVFLVWMALAFGGCSVVGVKKSPDLRYLNVATDLVSALYRVKGMAPIKTTLSMSKPKSDFGTLLYSELKSKGYGIRMIKKGSSSGNVVSYSYDKISRDDIESMFFQLSVGDIKLVREYEVNGGRVFPVSSMSVSGGEAAQSKLDDKSIFYYSSLKDKVLLRQKNTDFNKQPVFVKNTIKENEFKEGGECGIVNDTRNVDDLGHSNYMELFNEYFPVISEVILFDSDSIILRYVEKQRLSNLLKKYKISGDLVSILGVSRGKTAIKNGNSELARARSHTLKEGLVGMGVSPTNVFSEAAWSRNYKKGAARGVKVTIMRRKG